MNDSLKKFNAIYQGYKNYAFPSPEIEAMAEGRAIVCAGCEHCKPDAVLKALLPDKTMTLIKGAKCTACGCPLSAKVRQVLEDCPKGKWKDGNQ